MSPNASPYTQSERRKILDEFFQLLPQIDDPEKGGPDYDRALARISELWDDYVERTPTVPVSRCPFTRAVFQPSLDPFGFDGLFWKYDAAARPSEPLSGSLFAFTGAVSLREPIERAPFLCRPGPGAPFVVPRILERDTIRAVLSTVPIGAHTGYAMVYYSGQPVMDLGRFNTWGLDHYNLQLDEEEFGWNSCEPELQDYDFDLAPWIARGSLLWIAPGDETLELREGTDGCPYLDITDRHLPQCIEDGEVWTASLWDGTVPDDEPADAGPADVADGPSPVATENPAPEAAGPKFCSHCGAGLREGAKFCTGCGAKIGV